MSIRQGGMILSIQSEVGCFSQSTERVGLFSVQREHGMILSFHREGGMILSTRQRVLIPECLWLNKVTDKGILVQGTSKELQEKSILTSVDLPNVKWIQQQRN